jgi:hypothetical protein
LQGVGALVCVDSKEMRTDAKNVNNNLAALNSARVPEVHKFVSSKRLLKRIGHNTVVERRGRPSPSLMIFTMPDRQEPLAESGRFLAMTF